MCKTVMTVFRPLIFPWKLVHHPQSTTLGYQICTIYSLTLSRWVLQLPTFSPDFWREYASLFYLIQQHQTNFQNLVIFNALNRFSTILLHKETIPLMLCVMTWMRIQRGYGSTRSIYTRTFYRFSISLLLLNNYAW